ncbi:MAG: hypothetical protein ACAI44_39155 [Candidatus Sericytochromatia bacterium]
MQTKTTVARRADCLLPNPLQAQLLKQALEAFMKDAQHQLLDPDDQIRLKEILSEIDGKPKRANVA